MITQNLASIILPTYNGSRFIRASVESILGQSYSAFELIIVNDASTDSTPEILADYAKRDRRIKIINNPRNERLPESINIGSRLASGARLTWTSDDNIHGAHWLDTLMKESGNIGSRMVYTDYRTINDDGELLGSVSTGPAHELPFRNVIGASFLYSREIWHKVGEYRRKVYLAEDYDYWLRIFGAGFEMVHVAEAPYDYRLHAHSLTSTKKAEVFRAALVARDLNHAAFNRLSVSERFRARMDLGWYEWSCGMYKESINQRLRALSLQPSRFAAQVAKRIIPGLL